MSIRLACWLLCRRKRWLEQHVVGVLDYDRPRSLELDRVVKALEALG